MYNTVAIIKTDPLALTWITTCEDRTPQVILEANNNYRDPFRMPKLDQVIFRNDLTQELATDLCMQTIGEVDIVTNVAPTKAYAVQQSQFANLVSVKGNTIVTGVFNRYKQKFQDQRLRLAINYAINRYDIIKKSYNGYADLVPSLTPPWALDFPEGLTPLGFHPEEANKLLRESDWNLGETLKIASLSKYESVAQLIANQIEAHLKIPVNLYIIPTHEEIKWRKIIAEKNLNPYYDLFILDATALFLEGTPAFFHREFFGTDGALRIGPELPRFNELFNAMAAETNKELFLEKSKDVDRYVYEDTLSLFLFSPRSLYAVNKNVDFKPYITTLEFAETSVTQEHWSKQFNKFY
ncbi:ABC transporter substrate-binding protein [Filobacillus milosensis]|uniref:ABC transporter substrate-binding protein n=1 Tax=Filobacillus milosensis TaxID=94137 RepID=A0A4Y8IEH6_9BACI|nr:ABC transporter substrate-binding protein [Filobacillus milosensis]TFB14636.1 ABC transporter substrate-binding protein [Filobacillus milosensis]